MSSNRRNFLKKITIGGGSLAVGLPSFGKALEDGTDGAADALFSGNRNTAQFNMSGYRAPKLDKVRIGFVGLGMRGPGAVERISFIEGVEIKALCDKAPDRIAKVQKLLEGKGLPRAKEYSGENGWKALCESADLDLVYICTPWKLHTPMAVYAMRNGKHAATEVPAAVTLEECWELVETSEKTRKHCMMLENCCYDFFELLTLNMARQGIMGEIIHAEGAYIHNLLDLNFGKNAYADMWRLKENIGRDGNLYPTHGLGPIAQCMNINRGDQFDHLTSMSSNDFHMAAKAEELAAKDPFYKPFTGKDYRGNMNTTLIRSKLGKTIMLQHDVSSPRPYSRIHLVSGTKGMARKWPDPQRIAFGHEWITEKDMKRYEEKYTPEIVKRIGEMARQIGGHGGMDFMMDWRLIDCLRNGLPLDQDVYDAALWSAVAPLSEKSVAKKSRSVDVPDFTRGSWKTNKPLTLTLEGGGTTGVRNVKTASGNLQLKTQ